jgi:hypothetical protein
MGVDNRSGIVWCLAIGRRPSVRGSRPAVCLLAVDLASVSARTVSGLLAVCPQRGVYPRSGIIVRDLGAGTTTEAEHA